MNKHLILPLTLFCFSGSTLSHAENTPITQAWEASAELGYIKTSGNTDTETLNAKFKGETAYNKWTHFLELIALKSVANDVRSAEKYRIELQSDYDLGERMYAFGNANWENDNFSGLNYQAAVASGLGYKVIKNDEMKLNLELAPGYRITEDENNNTDEDAIIRLAETFSWDISETSTFDQYIKVDAGDSNTKSRLGAALTSKIAGDLSMKVSYDITHNSEVAADKNKTDRETAITLVYKL